MCTFNGRLHGLGETICIFRQDFRQVLQESNSISMTVRTPFKKSSRPNTLKVSLYPRSQRQRGQYFVRASGPEYRPLMQSSHPTMFLQHFAMMIGSFMHTTVTILHGTERNQLKAF